jgi:hypothetical protein
LAAVEFEKRIFPQRRKGAKRRRQEIKISGYSNPLLLFCAFAPLREIDFSFSLSPTKMNISLFNQNSNPQSMLRAGNA